MTALIKILIVLSVTAQINLLHFQATGQWYAGDSQLAAYAQEHADRLAAEDDLYHSSFDYYPGSFAHYGENVGVGPTTENIIQAFIASPTHLENITDPFTHIGVGVAKRDGKIWIVMVVASGAV